MGLGQRLRSWIDPPREPAPDDWVLLTTMPFHEGPMVHSALEAAGIHAVLQEWSPGGTVGQLPMQHRIVVRHRDLRVSEEIVADLRR